MKYLEQIIVMGGSCVGAIIMLTSALLPFVAVIALTKYIMGW